MQIVYLPLNFGAVAELEREYILQRQREGIAIAVVRRWRAGEMTAVEAMTKLGLKPRTFYRKAKMIR